MAVFAKKSISFSSSIPNPKQGFIDADGFDGGDGQVPALEATQGQIEGFFGQLPYKCDFEEVESVQIFLKIYL